MLAVFAMIVVVVRHSGSIRPPCGHPPGGPQEPYFPSTEKASSTLVPLPPVLPAPLKPENW
jgi:hypothetical protein